MVRGRVRVYRAARTPLLVLVAIVALTAGPPSAGAAVLSRDIRRQTLPVFPGADWQVRTPAEVGMSVASLDAIRDELGGRGAIVRNGYLIYAWGNVSTRADIASAAKPLYTHLLSRPWRTGCSPPWTSR